MEMGLIFLVIKKRVILVSLLWVIYIVGCFHICHFFLRQLLVEGHPNGIHLPHSLPFHLIHHDHSLLLAVQNSCLSLAHINVNWPTGEAYCDSLCGSFVYISELGSVMLRGKS